MNMINGNTQLSAMTNMTSMCQQSAGDYVNYYTPPIYQQQQQYIQNDLHQLLNNMYMVLSNQSKLLAYLIEKNELNIQTTTKIYE
jgi:hypothetical protein